MRAAVKDVAKYFPTAIISGRSRDKVKLLSNCIYKESNQKLHTNKDLSFFFLQVYELVGLTELYYAGSHGMDIMTPVNLNGSTEDSNSVKSTNQQVKNHYLILISIFFFFFTYNMIKLY